ncbi:hypothetical protein LCGC14_0706020 [marine sediment metagenome]|uniref:Uncharacterized protein n=1 Tax=marine sediment metagenome TaxID=412755 RepID=A0A0F9T2E0_9ZZZZ|nr:hypothetical protein [bacterium]
MTNSYLVFESNNNRNYTEWQESIIAPKFSLKNFANELHYYLRIYIIKKKSFNEILKFLFLNAIQRIFYTIGTKIALIRKNKLYIE